MVSGSVVFRERARLPFNRAFPFCPEHGDGGDAGGKGSIFPLYTVQHGSSVVL